MDFSGLHGTVDSPIWIGGIPGEALPVLRGGKEAINCDASSYIVFHDMEIEGCSENGMNINDGGFYDDYLNAHHFVFRSLYVRNVGAGGNEDSFKFSGINNYWVFDCEATNADILKTTAGNTDSSGIDQVGCHEAYIAGNYFHDLRGNAFQFKGGSYDADITQNLMVNCGERAVIIGGYTGFTAFRYHPDVKKEIENGEPIYEATNIRVYSNLIIDPVVAVAFVTAKDCYFVNNTVINPKKYLLRILHEDPIPEDLTQPHVNGYNSYNTVSNNIFYYGSLTQSINHNGASDFGFSMLKPETFTVENNLYFSTTNQVRDETFNFVHQKNAVLQKNPLFSDGDYSLKENSPAVGAGTPIEQFTWLVGGYNGRPFNKHSPTIGAFAMQGEDTPEKEPNFTDIAGYDWAKTEITILAKEGIINGVSPTQFAPSLQITRADYILLLVRMLGISADVADNFTDVSIDKYYYNEVGTAKALGVTNGKGNNLFAPEEPITRQDMFVLAYRILKEQEVPLAPAGYTDLETFSDHDQISDYAREALSHLVKNQLIQGFQNQLNPKENVTRAEAAVFICRIYQQTGGMSWTNKQS